MKRKKSEQTKHHLKSRLSPKTQNQAEYIRAIIESDITICVGPAGSGKTTVSVGLACEHLSHGKIERIIITRPIIESGRGLGFLPGSFHDKIHPYLVPVMEEMNKYFAPPTIEKLRKEEIVQACPLEYMRGRNFHNSFMILDEAQNATLEQIKMFVTRIGKNSRAVINGDLGQTDLPSHSKNGLRTCIDRLDNLKGVSICKLTTEDIIRNRIISSILSRLED